MSRPFIPGWRPGLESAAADRLARAGLLKPRPVGLTSAPSGDTSCARGVGGPGYDQGYVGSCHANAAAKAMTIYIRGQAELGAPWAEVALSRWIIRYQCRYLDGSLGSGADGGSILNSMGACAGPDVGGCGVCHEAMAPYEPDFAYLERRPPRAAFLDADRDRLASIAQIHFGDFDSALGVLRVPICIGIPWDENWDNAPENGIVSPARSFSGGHAVVVVAKLRYQSRYYYAIDNSHGPRYGVPPAEALESCPDYRPLLGPNGKSYHFLVSASELERLTTRSSYQNVVPLGMARGFERADLTPADMV